MSRCFSELIIFDATIKSEDLVNICERLASHSKGDRACTLYIDPNNIQFEFSGKKRSKEHKAKVFN
jgi:hypothetical protein